MGPVSRWSILKIAGWLALGACLALAAVGLLAYGRQMLPNFLSEVTAVCLEVGVAALVIDRLTNAHERRQWTHAYESVIEVSAQCTVDSMRLLYVRASPAAYSANSDRHSEFVALANLHLLDLRSMIERFANALDPETHEQYRRAERRLRWLVATLAPEVADPTPSVHLFDLMLETAEVVSSQIDARSRIYGPVRSMVDALIELGSLASPALDIGSRLDLAMTARLRAQTQYISDQPGSPTTGILSDIDNEFALPYFFIDLALLRTKFWRTPTVAAS